MGNPSIYYYFLYIRNHIRRVTHPFLYCVFSPFFNSFNREIFSSNTMCGVRSSSTPNQREMYFATNITCTVELASYSKGVRQNNGDF